MPRYDCKLCDYSCLHKSDFNKHLKSIKHKKRIEAVTCNICRKVCKSERQFKEHNCLLTYKCGFCGKTYKHAPSLSRHKVLCNGNNNRDIVLLKEQCEDALTIQHFALNLDMSIKDLLQPDITLLERMGNIMINNLDLLPFEKKPIHCLDSKKRNWLIKDAIEGWKEDNGNIIIKQMNFGIYKKFNGLWEKQYPNWLENEVLQVKWAELVRDLGADHADRKIAKVFKHIGTLCLLEEI